MSQLDTFGAYVRTRLEGWGREFALHRDCEYLGHQSKNMLQVLIEHQGEMPGRVTGFKPIEVNQEALQIEFIVSEMAKTQRDMACVLRGYYCGTGRKKFERREAANELLRAVGCAPVSARHFLTLHDVGFAHVRGVLVGLAIAA